MNSKSAPITFGPIAEAANTMALDEWRIFGSVWSPPHYMKEGANCNSQETKGGSLIMTSENLTQLGRYMAAYVKGWSAYWNAPLDIITVQNEPGIGTKRYSSCQYDPADLPLANSAVRSEFEANNIECDIITVDGPWYLSCWDHYADYLAYADAQRAHGLADIDGWAVHMNNWDGMRGLWDRIWNGGCDPVHGTPCGTGHKDDGLRYMWHTEESGENCNWAGAMQVADNVHSALYHGHCNAFVYWLMSLGDRCRTEDLTSVTSSEGLDTTEAKYCAFKHYCRYIRPGAVRIDVTPGEHDSGGTGSGLCTTAYKHGQQGTLTLVLTNLNATAYTANITLNTSLSISSFDAWRSSEAGERFASVGPCSVSGDVVTVEVPASSVTTLYGVASGGGDTTPPAAPTNLTAAAVGPGQVDLDWDDNTEPDLDSYNVYRDGAQIATGVTSSQYSDTGLSPSTQYCYTVTAVDTSNNESAESNQACDTTQEADTTPPAAPTNLTASAVSPSQIDLDWDDNSEGDLDSYNVYRGGAQIATDVTSSSYSDTGLSPATQYCYTVTAVDTSANESAESDQACATTQEGGSTMHVDSIVTGVLHGRYPGYWAKVTIVDGNGDLVGGATVTGTFDGWDDDTQSNVTETVSGVTGSDGLVELDSVIDSGQFCVDDVTHSTLTYDSSANEVTCVSF